VERLALETEKEWEAQGGAALEFAVEWVELAVVAACEVVVVPARTEGEEAHWDRNGSHSTEKPSE
jgi:hypothetical protein